MLSIALAAFWPRTPESWPFTSPRAASWPNASPAMPMAMTSSGPMENTE
jgi:hypothetical protein